MDDFHLGPAEAPWQQRYWQLSAGPMRSRLALASGPHLQAYGKWMSARVVQQGGVPAGRLCFALLGGAHGAGPARAQGRELSSDRLWLLRGGEEFQLQRPAGMELLSLSFDAEAFAALADAAGRPGLMKRLPPLVQLAPGALDVLRHRLAALFAAGAADPAPALFDELARLLDGADGVSQSRGSAAASYVVAQCHRLVLESGAAPPDIDTLCRRLRISRRSLQAGFRQVCGMTPVEYLRGLRLNLVRARLRQTSGAELSVAMAAEAQGFEQLSHFGARYKALFGELPSRTARGADSRSAR
ncbi:helix-turn-helix domain-containing protein [Pelomonas sp. KK5]|uniref:helix-turn-helix domain-containing protein n=1 Tax=Pelomonas sp. KK5 TaxID=1855730 RepID=UPI0009FA9FE4|nr:helix-turn-helix domain-containing protein [Pelomonas sp. KK5]